MKSTIPVPQSGVHPKVLSGVVRKTPVITIPQLDALFPTRYGISVHCGVIVVWDEDYDERVLRMIEERFPAGSLKPLAVCEHKGSIHILWNEEDAALYGAPEDYTTENDCWAATHYFLDGGVVKEAHDFSSKYHFTEQEIAFS